MEQLQKQACNKTILRILFGQGFKIGPALQECRGNNRMNCWKAKERSMPISSEATGKTVERSETKDTMVSLQRPTPRTGDDIVHNLTKVNYIFAYGM